MKYAHMKWWGWGDEGTTYDHASRPGLWPYFESHLEITEHRTCPVPTLDEITLPAQKPNAEFIDALSTILAENQIQTDKKTRLSHATGKSYRDLLLLGHRLVPHAPDYVIFPNNEAEVIAIVQAAHRHCVNLIPYGGGSNIVGALTPKSTDQRTVVSLDMCHMHRVLSVDQESHTACIEPGVYGPHLEQQLAEHGMTMGHFPDSFMHSTLGGWVMTRSAGMQSDVYGKIEDMVIGLRLVTPSGTLVTRNVPKSSNGIDVRQLCIGSEGILGVLTQLVMQVHKQPQSELWHGWTFPNVQAGIDAMHTCYRKGHIPTVARLSDELRTSFSFALSQRKNYLQTKLSQVFKWYFSNIKGVRFSTCCMSTVKYEGSPREIKQKQRQVAKIYRQYGGVCLGSAVGNAVAKGKFDFPYLRDYIMQYCILADVSETATSWGELKPCYEACRRSILQAIEKTGVAGWVGCHISHSYHTGASLYFTFGCKQVAGMELEQYLQIKKAAEDAFMQNNATLSHHHAVGSEHLPWVEADISPVGVLAIRGLKDTLDPNGIMNPGKIIPSDTPLEDWGLQGIPITTPTDH